MNPSGVSILSSLDFKRMKRAALIPKDNDRGMVGAVVKIVEDMDAMSRPRLNFVDDFGVHVVRVAVLCRILLVVGIGFRLKFAFALFWRFALWTPKPTPTPTRTGANADTAISGPSHDDSRIKIARIFSTLFILKVTLMALLVDGIRDRRLLVPVRCCYVLLCVIFMQNLQVVFCSVFLC